MLNLYPLFTLYSLYSGMTVFFLSITDTFWEGLSFSLCLMNEHFTFSLCLYTALRKFLRIWHHIPEVYGLPIKKFLNTKKNPSRNDWFLSFMGMSKTKIGTNVKFVKSIINRSDFPLFSLCRLPKLIWFESINLRKVMQKIINVNLFTNYLPISYWWKVMRTAYLLVLRLPTLRLLSSTLPPTHIHPPPHTAALLVRISASHNKMFVKNFSLIRNENFWNPSGIRKWKSRYNFSLYKICIKKIFKENLLVARGRF